MHRYQTRVLIWFMVPNNQFLFTVLRSYDRFAFFLHHFFTLHPLAPTHVLHLISTALQKAKAASRPAASGGRGGGAASTGDSPSAGGRGGRGAGAGRGSPGAGRGPGGRGAGGSRGSPGGRGRYVWIYVDVCFAHPVCTSQSQDARVVRMIVCAYCCIRSPSLTVGHMVKRRASVIQVDPTWR